MEITANTDDSDALGIVMSVMPPVCEFCQGRTGNQSKPNLEIVRLERKAGKFVTSGKINMGYCQNCGAAVREITQVVPLELKGLSCDCGSSKFRFTISSIKPNKPKDATEWVFDLDIICRNCNRVKFTEKILNFFKLKRIKVGVTGVDVQMR
jgi:hypothetical protein